MSRSVVSYSLDIVIFYSLLYPFARFRNSIMVGIYIFIQNNCNRANTTFSRKRPLEKKKNPDSFDEALNVFLYYNHIIN